MSEDSYKFKCKFKDLCDDLSKGLGVTHITFDYAGFGLAIVDDLKSRGINVEKSLIW